MSVNKINLAWFFSKEGQRKVLYGIVDIVVVFTDKDSKTSISSSTVLDTRLIALFLDCASARITDPNQAIFMLLSICNAKTLGPTSCKTVPGIS